MLSMKVVKNACGKDWNSQLFCISSQSSAIYEKENLVFLLYGKDPTLPTDQMLIPNFDRDNIKVSDYTDEMALQMSTATAHSKVKFRISEVST